MENLLETAQEKQNRSSEKMVLRHQNKHPPSEYEEGDTVIVKVTKSYKKSKGKEKTFVRSKREVVQQSGNRYKVEYKVSKGTRYVWFPVSMITSPTRAEEIKRQAKTKRNIARESLLNEERKIDTIVKKDNFEENDKLVISGKIFTNTLENYKKKLAAKYGKAKNNFVKREKRR